MTICAPGWPVPENVGVVLATGVVEFVAGVATVKGLAGFGATARSKATVTGATVVSTALVCRSRADTVATTWV
ncbi:MAG: hypothetical protein EOP01_10075 [Propionibacteriaceae bacterium]|nr:MAG: hypothetical protein EOP01_10075 [Propionibacteriaceae bacterium]